MSENTENTPKKPKNIYRRAGIAGVGVLAALGIGGAIYESQKDQSPTHEETVVSGEVPGANTVERIKNEQTASFLNGSLVDTSPDGTVTKYDLPVMEKAASASGDDPLNTSNYHFFLAGDRDGEPVLTEIAVSPQMHIELIDESADISVEAILTRSQSHAGQADSALFNYMVQQVPEDERAIGFSRYDNMIVGMNPAQLAPAQTLTTQG